MRRIFTEVKKIVRIKDSKLRAEFLRSNSEIYTQYKYNVTKLQLNSVTETIDCKQLILYIIIRKLFIYKIAEEIFS